jgi:hypothetical protein
VGIEERATQPVSAINLGPGTPNPVPLCSLRYSFSGFLPPRRYTWQGLIKKSAIRERHTALSKPLLESWCAQIQTSTGTTLRTCRRRSVCWRRRWFSRSGCRTSSRGSAGPGRGCSWSARPAPARPCWPRSGSSRLVFSSWWLIYFHASKPDFLGFSSVSNPFVVIRICGSVPLDYGSGSCSFLHWLSRCQQKISFFQVFFCFLLQSHRNQGFS